MSASLVELVVAIALAGILLSGALIPVTQTVHDYQVASAAVERSSEHALAGVRFEQVATAVWRFDDPPGDFGALTRAYSTSFAAGAWALDERDGMVRQARDGEAAAPLATDAKSFALSYRVEGGGWVSSVSAADFDALRAVRFTWSDAASGALYFGVCTPADAAFAGQQLGFPAAGTVSATYQRADHERSVALTVGVWK